ncbi:DUF3558 family protein [Nocardiopsis ganjiahuensis]|uniref:DUF3558 family protein n=1 Tax=Nocardiopsis ganjiahuensis TaxID=239984 RepID=UPI00034CD46A|nr:DUF3558 family protein [Nocardiopsis ganjiahuensis]
MRGRGRAAAAVAAVSVLVGACGGETELAERDSIDQFGVPPLEPTAAHPCDLITDDVAVELGILHEDGSGSAQSDSNCFFTDRVDASVDVRVEVLDETGAEDTTAVAAVVSAAFAGEGGQEFADVEGYPGVTTAFPDSCNLSVATSDEHELSVQVSADDACDTAVEIARTAIANSPEL